MTSESWSQAVAWLGDGGDACRYLGTVFSAGISERILEEVVNLTFELAPQHVFGGLVLLWFWENRVEDGNHATFKLFEVCLGVRGLDGGETCRITGKFFFLGFGHRT